MSRREKKSSAAPWVAVVGAGVLFAACGGGGAEASASTQPAIEQKATSFGPLSSKYDSLFASAGAKHGISPILLASVAKAESGFNPNAGSHAGAQGLMQLMPGTAKSLGVNPWVPSQAVDGAARMLAGLIRQFGSTRLAVAAYNAGPGAVQKYHGIPPYAETQNYVRKVMANMESAS